MDVLASTTIFTTATTHHYLHHITIKSTRPSLISRPSCLPLPGCLCGTLRRGGWLSRWWWPSPPPRATSSLASTFRTGCQACSWLYGILQILDIIFHPNFECCIPVLHPYHFFPDVHPFANCPTTTTFTFEQLHISNSFKCSDARQNSNWRTCSMATTRTNNPIHVRFMLC